MVNTTLLRRNFTNEDKPYAPHMPIGDRFSTPIPSFLADKPAKQYVYSTLPCPIVQLAPRQDWCALGFKPKAKPTLDEWHKHVSDDDARFRREVAAVRNIDGKIVYELFTGELVTPEQWRGSNRPDTPEAAVLGFIVQWYLAHRDLLEIAVKEALPEPPTPKPPKIAPAWEQVQDLPPMVLTREWLDPCADPVQRRREAIERVKALEIEPHKVAAPISFEAALSARGDADAWKQAREQGEKLQALYSGRYDWKTDTVTPRRERIAA